jgi:hypothetical protein
MEIRIEQLQSHIWGNICAFPHILGSPSSYVTLQLLHSEFPYIYGENFILFFISVCGGKVPLKVQRSADTWAPEHAGGSIMGPCSTLYKKLIVFPVPSRDVTYQTLPGRE